MNEQKDSDMPLIYREITGPVDYMDCIRFQRSVFGLSDLDIIPPPFFNALTRPIPRLGLIIGAYSASTSPEALVGMAVCMSTLTAGEIYLLALGVTPEYRKANAGLNLMYKLREVSREKKIRSVYCVFDPLESNLGRFYCAKLGFVGVRYEPMIYNYRPGEKQNMIPIDKMTAVWDLKTGRPSADNNVPAPSPDEQTQGAPETPDPSENGRPSAAIQRVCFHLPTHFGKIVETDPRRALELRLSSREFFTEHINRRGYRVTDFIFSSPPENGAPTASYILTKN